MTTHPPPARREDVVEMLHGVAVSDPYRWLENGDDAEVQRWVADQNRFTRTALDANPARGMWHERLCAFMQLPVVQAAQVRGDRLVLLERMGGAQQAQLVARSLTDLAGSSQVLIDPADGVDDAASAIDWFDTSPDGALIAYGRSEGGTENSDLRVLRIDDESHLDVVIPNCRAGSVAWEPDGAGFFYTVYPPGDQYHRSVRYHRLDDGRASDGSDDELVWAEHPQPEAWPTVSMSVDGRFLLVHVSVGWSRTDVHLLDRTAGTWADVISGVDAVSHFEFDAGGALVGTTTLAAERGRVVRVELDRAGAGPSAWTTLVPERELVTRSVTPGDGALIVHVSHAGVDALERWSPDAAISARVDGVGVSTVVQLTSDPASASVFAVLTGFDQPSSLWRLEDGAVHRLHPDTTASNDLTVTHVTYPSLDGTEIGMFLIHRSDVVPRATTPTILNGYGGFAITESPVWSPTIASWCSEGGLYAIAGLRGGFEHGEAWHQAGRRANKQNVFDDFHAAADWLVETGRTSRERLAIAGGSNGGLLVGVALTQRPDLCRAVWCAVPLLDMVRFPQFLIARLWTDEYGDPDIAAEFEWLYAYSPYHRVVDGTSYPAVLLTAAEGDSRVDPLHARKMAARLQHAAAGGASPPVYLHQERRAGHGVGKPVGKRADEQADVLAFLSGELGMV